MHLGASCSLTKYSYSWWLMKTHVRNSIFLLKDLCLLHFFREKVSTALFQETKRNEGSRSLAHPVRRVGFYFFKKVVWHEVVWLLILMLLHCLRYMKHLICRTICFWLSIREPHECTLTNKKKGIYPIYMRPRSCCTTRWSGDSKGRA